MPVNFIAEIGQNHQGSLKIAKQMVDSLLGSRVKIIKTAKRDVDSFPEEWKTKEYDNPNSFGKTYYEHRKHLELSNDDFMEFMNYVEFFGFEFMSSFTDLPSFRFLVDECNLKSVKVASSRNIDHKLLEEVNNWGGRVFLSSGMTSDYQFEKAINTLNNCEVITLQCTSAYPTKYNEINLNYMSNECLDGLSGHHTGILPDIVAYTMGASWIERHYTLNTTWKGTDQSLSITRAEVDEIISTCEKIDEIKGSGVKEILPSEQKTIHKLRFDLL